MPYPPVTDHWDRIENVYLTGTFTYVQLAAMFKMSAAQIRRRSKVKEWPAKKKRLQAEKAAADQLARDVLAVAIEKTPLEKFQEAKATFKQRVAVQNERVLTKLETKAPETFQELDGFADVLNKAQKIGDSAYGLEIASDTRVVLNLAFLAGRDPD